MKLLTKYGDYVEESISFSPQSKIMLTIGIIIEYFPSVILGFLSTSNLRIYFTNNEISLNDYTESYYFKVSLIPYIISNISDENRSLKIIILVLSLVISFLILFGFYIFLPDRSIQNKLSHKNISKKENLSPLENEKKFSKFYKILIVWFYDYYFFRIGAQWILLVCVNAILGTYLYNSSSFFFSFFGCLVGLCYFVSSILYFKFTFFYVKFDKKSVNYPFDNFSSHYEMIMFIYKFFIAIGVNSFLILQTKTVWCWTGIIVIIIPITFLSILILKLLYHHSFLIFIRNEYLNSLRVFILLIIVLNLLIHLFFSKSMNLYCLLTFYFTTTLLSFCIIYSISFFQIEKVVKGTDFVNKILIMMELYTSGNQSKFINIIKEMSLIHFERCPKPIIYCKVCQFFKGIDKFEFDLISIIELIFYSLKEEKINMLEERSIVVESFLMINSTRKNFYLLNLFYSKKIAFLYRKFPILAMNLMYYFKKLLNKDITTIIQVQSIQILENQRKNFTTFLDIFRDIVSGIEISPQFFVHSSTKTNKLRDEIKKKLIKSNENSYDYQVIILKYIYEVLFNSKIKKGGNEFNIYNYDEMLQEHYENDKYFLLNYEMDFKSLEIIRTSKEYSKYVHKSFDSFLPFKDIGIHYLFDCLKNQNQKNIISNIYEYPIQDPENPDFICSFKMNFKIFPSIDLKNFLILSFYQNKYSNVLITLKDQISKDEQIITFNSQFKDYLLISPKIINYLNFYNKHIYFKDIFYDKVRKDSYETKNKEVVLNYKRYLPLIKSKLNFFFEIEGTKTTEEKESFFTIITKESLGTKSTKKQQELEITFEKEFYSKINANFMVKVLYFRKLGKANHNLKVERDSFTHSSMNNLKLFSTINEGKTDYLSKALMNSNSSLTKGQNSSSKLKSLQGNIELIKKFQSEEKKKRVQTQKFTFFTLLILIYNILLILITILFLIFEIRNNNIFQKTFTFFQQWHKYSRLFMNATLSFFMILCPSKRNLNKCESVYNLYSQDLSQMFNLDSRLDLMEYVREELKQKVNFFQSLFFQIKTHVYGSNEENLMRIAETFLINYSFSEIDGNYSTVHKNVTFFEDLNIFLNLLNSVANSENFTKIPMQILNKKDNGKLDLSYLIVKKGDEIKLDAYSIIINYRKMLSLNELMSSEITNTLLEDLGDCNFIGTFFSVLLIINHAILMFICFCMVKVFKNIMVTLINEIREKIYNFSLVQSLKEKITILTTLLTLYKENPNKLNSSYERLRTENRSRTKTQKDTPETPECLPIKRMDILSDTVFDSDYFVILKPTINIIILLFFFYFAFAILYFFIYKSTLSTYTNLINTFNKNAELDAIVYSICTVFQVMLFTNQTDIEMQEMYETENITEGYISSSIKKGYRSLFEVEQAESSRQSHITPLRTIIDLSCNTMLHQVKDLVLADMDAIEKYQDFDIKTELGKVCTYYDFTEYKNDKIYIREILYRVKQLNTVIVHTFEDLYAINISRDLFDLYLFILLFYRPVRNYESAYVFLDFIDNITDSYTIVIYTYLVLNTFFELAIFLLLKYLVISQYIYTNKSLNMLSKCLKV